jgi:hypothetical protein
MAVSTGIDWPAFSPSLEGGRRAALRLTGIAVSRLMRPWSIASNIM